MRPCVKKEASGECGDRKSGQVLRENREPHAAGTAAGNYPARRLLESHIVCAAAKSNIIAQTFASVSPECGFPACISPGIAPKKK